MKPRLREIAFHALMFVVVLVVLSVLAVWLGLGPAVHSDTRVANASGGDP